MSSVTCPQCGTVNPAGTRFCQGCGLSLTQRLRQSGALNRPPTPTPPSQPPSSGAPTVGQGAGQPGVPPQPVVAQALGGQIGMTPLAAGITLQAGRYVIDKALGAGGMGSVFLAHDTHVNNKPVVIKEMANVYATEQERREAEAEFQAEMATLAALNHPNIPQISDFFTESNRHFAVQEYVGGADLQKAIEAAQIPGHPPQGLPEKQVLSWVSQVLAVLDYLETQNPQVIHRDIKPGNIIVDTGNRVKVVDFGIASHKFKPGSTRAMGQQLSTALGTPGYAPKEQFSGQETVLSDLYALGATMHHLLTGRDPTKIQQLWQYPPVRTLNRKVSEATERIVTRATQNDPGKRYQSAAEMKKAVDRVLNPPGALNTVRGRAIALLVVLLLLAGVGGGAFLYATQQSLLPATGSISDGGVAFDTDVTGRTETASDPQAWATIKRQASIDWKNGNKARAVGEYAQATGNDRTDAESWIYQENYRAETASSTPIYLAVGGSFSGKDVFAGREILQGVYTAQKEIDDHGGINGHLIALVLADDASSDGGALQSAQKVAARNDVLALVGYRTSPRTANALPALTTARISVVTPTASNPNLTGSPYFFRVCPNDSLQAAQAVRYMLSRLVPVGKFNARVALVADPNDAYSSELKALISGAVRRLGGHVIDESYTVGVTTDFSAQAQNSVAQHADVMYFAGYAREGLRLAQALDAVDPQSRLSIMTDQEFYNPSEFVAQPGHKSRFHFTSFFYPDQASEVIIPPGPQVIQTMEGLYSANFHRADLPFGRYGSDRVPAGAALSYDALHVVADAVEAASRLAGGALPGRDQVRAGLAAIGTTAPRYQGMTGPIAFDAYGNPLHKTVLILHLDPQGHTKMDGFLMDGWLGQY